MRETNQRKRHKGKIRTVFAPLAGPSPPRKGGFLATVIPPGRGDVEGNPSTNPFVSSSPLPALGPIPRVESQEGQGKG